MIIWLCALMGATTCGAVGWWLGERIGLMAAFMLAMAGTGAGAYWARRWAVGYWG